VLVHWTNDLALSSRLDPKVAHYYAQAELHKATFAGFDAYDAGRLKAAARAWGKAVQLATASGNTEVLTRLERLVEVIDAGQGMVRIKQNLSREDLLRVAAGSAISSPFSGEQRRRKFPPTDGDRRSAKPDVRCTGCGRLLPGTATFCGSCGRRLGGQRR
jgi:von Willebrand factor type A C-terminal domain